MIEVSKLTKRFGEVTAVDDLSFRVEEGELFALLGRNGAGKSTTISCMTTILGFDSGEISLDDKTVGRDDHAIRGTVGVVFQNSVLDPILTVSENLRLKARLYGVGSERIDELVHQVEVDELVGRRYGVLSGGERRRVDIARALLHSPRTLFLDEPTTGLDPQSRETVWRVIAELREAASLTVLLTTHYMEETEDADHVMIVDHGRAIASGTPIELRAEHSLPQLSLAVAPEHVADMMRSVKTRLATAGPEFGHEPIAEGGAWHLRVPDSSAAFAILDDLRDELLDFEFRHGSMQDVFLQVTGEKGKTA
ncbi:MAG TPA: ABC transporter ATP-binding protein [Actinomycetaceae bacterium]|nr:ABC transporter ATP-binding protein [Actinomycetaceae bacterium]